MEGAAKLAVYWNIPIIGFISTGPELIDKSTYQTLARVSLTQVKNAQEIPPAKFDS